MKHKKRFIILISGVTLLLLLGCGKKGPPFLPKKNIPPRVEQLTGEWKNGSIVLQGRIAVTPQAGDKKDALKITGCRIYHSWYAMENPPCEGCPIDYPGYHEVEGEVLTGERFFCEVSAKKSKGIHFLEVRLIGQDGTTGPPSNRVKLTVEDRLFE